MNQNKLRLYGILVDISGSMKQCYQKMEQGADQVNEILQPNKTRLISVWEIIQAAFQKNHLQDDYIFLSAFGCHHEVDVIDLIPFLKSIIHIFKLIYQIRKLQDFHQKNQQDYQQLLYQFVKDNGAKNLSQFYSLNKLKTDITKFKAKLLYYSFKENKKYLESFIQQLPKQVKNKTNKHKFQAFIGKSFNNNLFQNPIAQAIQQEIQLQLNNLDNYIRFDYFLDKILQCLKDTLNEIKKIKNQNNIEINQVKDNLQQIINEFSDNQIQIPELLQKLLVRIEPIQQNILNVLHKYSFIPQDIINEQTNLQRFSINTVDNLIKQMQIEEDREESFMIKEDLALFKQFESISYGGTPLIKCLNLTLNTQFQQFQNKFLFIVSDGDSTDGNPLEYATQLKNEGFIIFCYYIVSSKKIIQNQLYSKVEYIKGDGAKRMFEMSSEYSNFEFPLRQLETYTNFKLSEEGKSRLFLQNNDPEQLKQFFDYFMKISKDFDKLIEVIGKITIQKYINSSKEFEPQQQIGGTCYANSIAAVYSIMMSKIYKRDGQYPGFFRIRDLLIQQYGKLGGKTIQVVEETCKDFRLQCRRIKNISQIKQALHKGRPIISRFILCEDQWNADNNEQIGFKTFFRNNPKGILSTVGPRSDKSLQGHSVVLYSYTADYYLFINSWGTKWGDNGYFKVKDLDVINDMEFIEVFWNSTDLTESEKQLFKQDAGKEITKFYQNYLSSIGDIKYTCPQCYKQSCINQYKGNYYEAQCPMCNNKFHPEPLGQLFVDYLNGKNV